MNTPCKTRKKVFLSSFGKNECRKKNHPDPHKDAWFSNCRSPLNMKDEDCGLFLNYWNLNQTFFLKGRCS